jgi:hypothetical protein
LNTGSYAARRQSAFGQAESQPKATEVETMQKCTFHQKCQHQWKDPQPILGSPSLPEENPKPSQH